MSVPRLARGRDDMRSKLIDKEGRKSITDEVKIRKLHNHILDIIKKSITAYLTDDVIYNHIVNRSEQFEGSNRGANAEHTKSGYSSKVSRYNHTTRTPLSYPTEQARPDKDQAPQNRTATPGARSIASVGTNASD